MKRFTIIVSVLTVFSIVSGPANAANKSLKDVKTNENIITTDANMPKSGGYVKEVCKKEIATHCANLRDPKSEMMECLESKMDKLSAECKAKFGGSAAKTDKMSGMDSASLPEIKSEIDGDIGMEISE